MKHISKIIATIFILSVVFSCSKKIDQSTMFSGRAHKTKKKGIYDAGMSAKKPISVQIAKDYDKLSKHDSNPKKAAKKANKDLEKKKKIMAKKVNKFKKKKRLGVKPGKTKTSGEK